MIYVTKKDTLANLARAVQDADGDKVTISLYDAHALFRLDSANAEGYIPVDLSRPLPGTKKKRSDAGTTKPPKTETVSGVVEAEDKGAAKKAEMPPSDLETGPNHAEAYDKGEVVVR